MDRADRIGEPGLLARQLVADIRADPRDLHVVEGAECIVEGAREVVDCRD